MSRIGRLRESFVRNLGTRTLMPGYGRTPPAEADVGSRTYQSARLPTTATTLVFLGIDDRPCSTGTPAKVDPKKPEGVPYFAVAVPSAEEGEGKVDGWDGVGEWVEPRLAGASLDPWQANIFAEARAMVGQSSSKSPATGRLADSRGEFRLERKEPLLRRLWQPRSLAMVRMETSVWESRRRRAGWHGPRWENLSVDVSRRVCPCARCAEVWGLMRGYRVVGRGCIIMPIRGRIR